MAQSDLFAKHAGARSGHLDTSLSHGTVGYLFLVWLFCVVLDLKPACVYS